MLTYLINRWLLASHFKKVEKGYVCRRRTDLPGIEITGAERKDVLRDFHKQYWRSSLLEWIGILAGIAAIIAIGLAFGLSDASMSVATGVLFVGILAYSFKQQRKLLTIPEEKFPSRARVEAEETEADWFVRYQRFARKRTIPSHIFSIAIAAGGAWLFAPTQSEPPLQIWTLFLISCVSFVVGIYAITHKMRHKE